MEYISYSMFGSGWRRAGGRRGSVCQRYTLIFTCTRPINSYNCHNPRFHLVHNATQIWPRFSLSFDEAGSCIRRSRFLQRIKRFSEWALSGWKLLLWIGVFWLRVVGGGGRQNGLRNYLKCFFRWINNGIRPNTKLRWYFTKYSLPEIKGYHKSIKENTLL